MHVLGWIIAGCSAAVVLLVLSDRTLRQPGRPRPRD
jgi:hypothetical protein